AAALGPPPPDGDDVLQALREARDRLVHAADLLLGEVEEALLGEALEALAVLALHVLAVELLAHERLHQVLEVAQAAGEILVEASGHLGRRAGEAAAQLLQLRAEVAQAERAGQRVREAPFLEAVLDLAELGLTRRLSEHLLETPAVGTEERLGQRRQLDALLLQQALELLQEV